MASAVVRPLLVSLLVLAIGALSAPPARAQTTDTAVSVCVSQSGGRLRASSAAGACKDRETPLDLALAPGPDACRVVARLTLPGVVGDGPNGSIDLYAYSVGVQAAGAAAVFTDLAVTKALDQASPALFQAVVAGTLFPTAQLEVLGAGGVVATTYQLTSAVVTSFSVSGPPPCSTSNPTEQIHVTYVALAILPPS